MMRLFRVHQRAIGFAAACLLVAQSLVAGHVPMPEASVYDPVLGEMVICTQRALVYRKDAGQLPVPSEHKSQCPCCVLGCLSGCGGGAVAVAVQSQLIAVMDRATGASSLPVANDAPASYLRLTTTHPRAPPPLIS